MNELLPCPFCGGKAKAHESREWFGAYSIYCTSCGASVGDEDMDGTSLKDAVWMWNRRNDE